jgi:thiol-disulfide isomerase/thioredoxin
MAMATTEVEGTGGDPSSRPARRRIPMALVTWAFVLLILVLVVLLLIVQITRGTTTVHAPPVAPAPGAVVRAATSVPAQDFDAIGAPQAGQPGETLLSGQGPLTVDGRPAVVFVGAEFCPYCAAERWALVVALGRFGTFSHLGATSSSASEVFPGTPTFSFVGTTYASAYLRFAAVEEFGGDPATTSKAGFPRLRGLDDMEATLLRRYDTAPYVPDSGVLPFVDVGDRLVESGAGLGFSPGVFQGLSMAQVATDLGQPQSPVAQAVLGAANRLTAAMCAVTGDRPAAVCSSAGVRAGAARLGLPDSPPSSP